MTQLKLNLVVITNNCNDCEADFKLIIVYWITTEVNMKVWHILVMSVSIRQEVSQLLEDTNSLNMKESSILVMNVTFRYQHREVLNSINNLNMKLVYSCQASSTRLFKYKPGKYFLTSLSFCCWPPKFKQGQVHNKLRLGSVVYSWWKLLTDKFWQRWQEMNSNLSIEAPCRSLKKPSDATLRLAFHWKLR